MADPSIPQNADQQRSGSSVRAVYTERQMTYYALTETEISTISSINASVSLNFSVGSALFGIGISVYINAAFYSTINATGLLAEKFAAPLVLAVSLVFVGFGVIGIVKRYRLWNRLKAESKITEGLPN